MSKLEERYIGYLVSDVARLLRTVFDRRVRHLGLTRTQWLALTRLYRRPGASQSDVADMLEIERATAGRLIDRLEAGGFVERRDDARDRRINRIYLSAEAERVLDALLPIAAATNDEAMSEFSEGERQVLTKLLTRMKARLQEMADQTAADDRSEIDGAAENSELVS